MIRKLKSGKYRLYSRKKNSKTNKRETWEHLIHFKLQKNMSRRFSISKDIDPV
jgi:hypothetical protein